MGPRHIPESKSYHKRIYRIRRGVGFGSELGFARFGVVVTPKQLNAIQRDIERIRPMIGLTCMHVVKKVLDIYTNFSIPSLICWLPTVSATYLLSAKKSFWVTEISHIEPHFSHRPVGLKVSDAVFGILPEVMSIAILVTFLYVSVKIYVLTRSPEL